MQCPNCRHENPDKAQQCGSCGLTLKRPETERLGQDAKISKMTIYGAAFQGLAVALALFVKPTLSFLAALLSFSLSIAAIKTIRGNRNSKGKGLAIAVLILSFGQMVLLTYWRIDAAPLPDDYTISDLRSAPAQYNQTYDLLKSVVEDEDQPGAPAIGLSADDVTKSIEIDDIFKEDDLETIAQRLQEREQEILSIWQSAKKGRDIFAKLDSFPEIADLKEPNFEIDRPWATGMRRMMFLHRAYICLQSCQGNHETALDELMRLDSLVRKMSLTARSSVIKLTCFAYFRINVETANFIVNSPDTPKEVLLSLKRRMVPFSNEHVSLRNPMIFEYLTCKNELKEVTHDPCLRYSSFSPLKLNSTLRLFRNFFDKPIVVDEPPLCTQEFRVWPSIYPTLAVSIVPGSKLPWYYRLYNPFGSILAELVPPAREKVVEIRTKLQVHPDLLQIVLDKRLGKEVSLKARAYSEEYTVDVENKKIFSPGPDGKPGTKDDIKLSINPEVLGWGAR